MTRDDFLTLKEALDPANPWQKAYPVVEQAVRAFLVQNPFIREEWSTNELVEGLWPETLAKGEDIDRRKRLYTALKALATRGLSDCCYRGPETETRIAGVKRLARPWRWHAPKEKPIEWFIGKSVEIGQTVTLGNGQIWERRG